MQNKTGEQNRTKQTKEKETLDNKRLVIFFLWLPFLLDADECSASGSFCDVNADCENILSSYRCLCKPGFSGDGRTCSGIVMIHIFSKIIMTLVSKLNLFMQMVFPTFLLNLPHSLTLFST